MELESIERFCNGHFVQTQNPNGQIFGCPQDVCVCGLSWMEKFISRRLGESLHLDKFTWILTPTLQEEYPPPMSSHDPTVSMYGLTVSDRKMSGIRR